MTRARRILLRTGLCVALAAIVALGLGAWLVRSDPSWYRRVQLTAAEQAAAEQRLFNRLATLRNELGAAEAYPRNMEAVGITVCERTTWPSFDIEISEAEVNGPLTRWWSSGSMQAWAQANPDARAALEQIEEPHVRFLDGSIELAGRSTSLGTLVSLSLSVEQPKGGPPQVTLGRPWAGRFPLARSIIEEPARRALAGVRGDARSAVPREVLDAADQLVAGEPTQPVIIVSSSTEGSGLIAARVERLDVTAGKLRATLRPVGKPR